MQRFPRRWDKKTCIDFLQRKIIVLSIIYYELSQNVVDDSVFDSYCRQLVQLHSEYGDISSTQYGYAFGDDFDGSTGFYLYDALTPKDQDYLMLIARCVLRGNIQRPQVEPKIKKKGKLF